MSTHFKGSPEEILALNASISLSRASITIGKRIAQKIAAYGLTVTQFGVLESLFHLGQLKQHVIGEKMLASGANITFVIDKLALAGYVVRLSDPNDRRCKTIQLTDAGRELIENVFPEHVEFITGLMGALSKQDQIELTRICKQLGLSNRN